ncbi:MAG: 4-phosphoerythronate dehydrogenase [Gammaproteobacteria bacterium]
MKIVADENIAQLAATFADAGELVALPGRQLDAAAVKDADALLVRSVTKVDAGLLAGSRCRFVGTATSGIDHVDTEWLAAHGIAFASARGCNAEAVVDYVFSALAGLSERDGFDWRTLSIGIVGGGEIGRRLAQRLLDLRMRIAIYDPFLSSSHPLAAHFSDYEAVLQQDVITFHTPLTRTGAWPTWHMFDAARIAALRPEQVVINASRGGVIDNAALLAHLQARPQQRIVLDAWEHEPAISLPLLERVRYGSAHIAGYSLEGKVRGTQMIAHAFAAHFGMQIPEPPFGAAGLHPLAMDTSLPPWRQLNALMLQVYDVARDDALLRATLGRSEAAAQFDLLRKHYPLRREFARYVQPEGLDPALRAQAAALGFLIA